MNKKGFTLIELLAVIVILAIIALIATPIILNVIETARKGSKESSALGYVNAIEKQVMISQVDTSKAKIVSGTYSVEQLTNLKVDIKGEKPENTGIVKINNKGAVSEAWFTYDNGKYKVYYNGSKAVASTGNDYLDSSNTPHNEIPEAGSSNGGSNTTVATFGGTKVEATSNDTHKGIVYLDPTDLSTTCNSENSVSTTEVKTGCMKWYIFDDSGDNYTMILDHNTTAHIKWDDSNSNVAYESSNLKVVLDDLVDSSDWKVTPRLITVDEVNTIVGGVSTFDAADYNTWFYFDGTGTKKQTRPTYNSSNRSNYDWLYNNLLKCETDSVDYGCTIEDNNSYISYGTAETGQIWSYWTSTPVGTAGSGSRVWLVYRYGRLIDRSANNSTGGVRPVIEIPKRLID